MEWFLSPLYLGIELLKLFHYCPLFVETFDKTTLPSSIFKRNPSFLVLFINFICGIKIMNLFEYISLNVRNHLQETRPPRTCLSVFYSYDVGNTLNTFYAVSLKNFTGKYIFSNCADLLLQIDVHTDPFYTCCCILIT